MIKAEEAFHRKTPYFSGLFGHFAVRRIFFYLLYLFIYIFYFLYFTFLYFNI